MWHFWFDLFLLPFFYNREPLEVLQTTHSTVMTEKPLVNSTLTNPKHSQNHSSHCENTMNLILPLQSDKLLQAKKWKARG